MSKPTRHLGNTITLVQRHYKLLIKCWLLVIAIRLVLTFRGYQPVLEWIKHAEPTPKRKLPVVLLIWCVDQTARFVPAASCLTRALALRYLLAQAGEEAKVQIGVAIDKDKQFEAHAWVTFEGRILIGGVEEDVDRFKPIVAL